MKTTPTDLDREAATLFRPAGGMRAEGRRIYGSGACAAHSHVHCRFGDYPRLGWLFGCTHRSRGLRTQKALSRSACHLR
jgi:hypothetical protein